MRSFAIALFALISAAVSAHGQIDVENIPRTKDDFSSLSVFSETDNVRVKGVKVLIADYELIARDFPKMARHSGESIDAWKGRIDGWLTHETGFIAVEQTRAQEVNTPIPTSEETKKAYRPHKYNRAFVIPVDGGFIDAKGTGSQAPQQKHHGNGLGSTGEMIREYVFEKLVSAIMEHAEAPVKTVACYAVLDYGFDIIHADGSRSRAGTVLRQAHRRSKQFNSSLELPQGIRVEKILRQYGLTSSGETASGKNGWDYINIQGTDQVKVTEIIDFGAYLAADNFTRRTVSPFDLNMTVFDPSGKDFVQPDPRFRIPMEMWGHFGNPDPKADRPWVWSHELAQALAEGRADRSAVETHIANFLNPVKERMKAHPRFCHRIFNN